MTNSLTPSALSGRHLVSPPPHPSHPVPSPCLTHPLPHTLPPPLPSLLPPPSVWVTPGRVSASDPGTAFFPPSLLPSEGRGLTARRPDTNVIKNEKQLVRVAASVDMKCRAEERSDGRLTVQSERFTKKEKKKKRLKAPWPSPPPPLQT